MDESCVHNIQAAYLITGDKTLLGSLYSECLHIARERLGAILRATQFCMEEDKFNMSVHDATANLIEYFLKKPDYVVRFFSRRIDHEIRRVLYTKYGREATNRRWEAHNIQLDTETHSEIAQPEKQEAIDLSYAFQDILTEHPRGKEIMIEIYRSRTYKSAIISISKIASKQWIYDRAEKLYRVYRLTRKWRSR